MSSWNQPPGAGQPPSFPPNTGPAAAGAPQPYAAPAAAAQPGWPAPGAAAAQPYAAPAAGQAAAGAMPPTAPAAQPMAYPPGAMTPPGAPAAQPMAQPPGAMVPVAGQPLAAAGQAPAAQPLSFKFSLQKAPSFRARQGVAGSHQLELDGMVVPYACVQDSETRDNNLVLMLSDGHLLDPTLQTWLEDGEYLVLQARGPSARELEAAIDRGASWFAAERRRAALAAEGREAEFRTLPCPKCGATIDLSSLPPTQYVYCRFCLSVYQPNNPQAESDDYRTCDECGMFDRVKGYTEFYFYFLLIVWGFSSTRRHMCDTCAGGLFWKTFLINLIFLLGVPSAIWIKLKSLSGRDPELKLLAKANRLARKGRMQEAKQLYLELHQRYPNHPGLLTNEARGHVEAGDPHSAGACLEAALQSCPNYLPAFELMEALHQAAQPALPQAAGYG